MNYQVTEKFSDGNLNDLGTFDTEKEANTFFSERLKSDGGKPTDMENWELELNKLTLNEDGDVDDIVTIKSQKLYEEGMMDRKNHKGENAIMYGFESVWNAEKGQLLYTFFFQGKKEEKTFLESELKKWYF